jgi:hypothetical protein
MRNCGIIFILLLLLGSLHLQARQKRFYNLTTEDVRVDSVIPEFVYSIPLAGDYKDSVYTASLSYPEFVDMTLQDVAAYQKLSGVSLPEIPSVKGEVNVSRADSRYVVSFCPLVYRNGKYQILVSFMLTIESNKKTRSMQEVKTRATGTASVYADHSVLSSGNWAKIRVPSTGVYQLTDAIIKKAGFTDLSKVKVYGYGGNLQSEVLNSSDLSKYDDLQEVPTCTINGCRLFYAKGPVSWSSNNATRRTRNPYSDYGYYFITQSDNTPESIDSVAFLHSFYPSSDYYHSLYEVDGYSWYPGGRNLFDKESVSVGNSKMLVLNNTTKGTTGKLSVAVTAGSASTVSVFLNGRTLGNLSISLGSYDKGNEAYGIYTVSNLTDKDTVKISPVSGGPIRLDYVSMAWDSIMPAPDLGNKAYSVPTYVCNITNQDHHADSEADMVIIIPTSQKLLSQAERLKTFHENHDKLSVNIVPADELYNEFSSGTPDANAYRRYLKMLYDRANGDESKMPKYLLLFGDCVWDNRMLTSDCSSLDPDDYLLAYESENSFNEITCYVDDSWYGILQDGKGGDPATETIDVGVGRFPVTTVDEAKIMVDKTINYAGNENAGSWQNTLMFMGDDGNYNLHMNDENEVADYISNLYPGYLSKKVMWDAYTRETSSTGNTYPEVSGLIKKQQASGALIMDYAGHGSETQISHEAVLKLSDFSGFTNTNLPLWITASCDIMPFDGVISTIGESAVLNSNGGAVAFYGTTRTVYADLNKRLNRAFLKYVLSRNSKGNPLTLGEAHRLAQNEMMTGTGYNGESDRTTNHLQYSLLGDPALSLNLPDLTVQIDSINGISTSSSVLPVLKVGSVVRVKGHIKNGATFKGVVTATVRDSKESVVCKKNDPTQEDTAFVYTDRTKTLYSGSDSVSNGQFVFSFAVPRDINYSNGTGLMNLYAVSNDHGQTVDGYNDKFHLGGSEFSATDTIGPSVYCYLNTSSFVDGGDVNTTPYFVAELADTSGINATGNGVGHDMELIIDGDMSKTYSLNDNFAYDFGTYTRGTTYYSIPELTAGRHSLLFRAWDTLNNSSVVKLNFNVVQGLSPNIVNVSTTRNPASSATTFIITHDFSGSNIDVIIDVYDMSGRQLWEYTGNGISASGTFVVNWDLCTSGGQKLPTGVYIYRVRLSSNGSSKVSKAKKLIIVDNN